MQSFAAHWFLRVKIRGHGVIGSRNGLSRVFKCGNYLIAGDDIGEPPEKSRQHRGNSKEARRD